MAPRPRNASGISRDSRRRRGFVFITHVLSYCQAAAFAGFFLWDLSVLFPGRCTKGNGCKTCSLNIKDIARKPAFVTGGRITCDRVAATTLDIDSSCMSFSLDNKFDDVDEVFKRGKKFIARRPVAKKNPFCCTGDRFRDP